MPKKKKKIIKKRKKTFKKKSKEKIEKELVYKAKKDWINKAIVNKSQYEKKYKNSLSIIKNSEILKFKDLKISIVLFL